MPSRKYSINIALILIIAIAVFFRFWQFTSIPAGLYQDEAMNGSDALALLQAGDFSAQGGPASGWKVFYTNNNGREGMIVWLDALAIKIFGASPWVLRLFPAIAGVLAVLGLYFLAKELFNAEVALIASFFMATSFWAVNFSRIGFRAGLMLPFLIWSFYFLYRSISGIRAFSDFIIAGILFGLGFYTYIPFRFAPILALVFLPALIKQNKKKLWLGVLFFIFAVLVVVLPIGLYFLHNPGDFFGRSSGVSIFSSFSPIKAAAISVVETLGMFNFVGDFNWRHNYAGSPELFVPVGLLFLLGIWLSTRRWKFEDKFLLSWLAVFLLPNVLTNEGNPHALRALGALPAAMIFAGIGLIWLYKKIQKKEVFIFLIIFLVFAGAYNFNEYFNCWAFHPKTLAAFSYDQVKIADYFNSLPQQTEKYAIWSADDRATDNGLPVSAQTVYFLTAGKSEITYLRSDKLDKIKVGKNGAVIAPLYFNLDLLHNLNKQFPQSKINFIYINTAVAEIP